MGVEIQKNDINISFLGKYFPHCVYQIMTEQILNDAVRPTALLHGVIQPLQLFSNWVVRLADYASGDRQKHQFKYLLGLR